MPDLSPYQVQNHHFSDYNMLVNLGTTASGLKVIVNKELAEAELIVLIGTIEPHMIAGFGGGLKNIIPGCAGRESIAGTHLIGEASTRFSGVGKRGEECPTRLLLEEGALLLQGDIFLVNTVLQRDGRIAGVFCGHPVQAHRQGCELAEKIYGVKVGKKADVALVGSNPMDIDLWQGIKCLGNVSAGVKDEGLIIAFIRCSQGTGDMKIPREPFVKPGVLNLLARVCGTEKLVAVREQFSGAMDTGERFMNEMLTELNRRHRILVYAPDIPCDTGEKLGFFEVFDQLEDLMKRAVELVPAAERVYSLPQGGVTYVKYTNDRGHFK